MEQKPALIIVSGAPRSGTTWLGKLLDSHPETLYRHEPDKRARLPLPPLITPADYQRYSDFLRRFISQLPSLQEPTISASLPVFSKAFTPPRQRLLTNNMLRLVKVLSSIGVPIQVPRFCLPHEACDYVVVWKSIQSSGRLNLYADVIPHKRILYIIRHPCAVVFSQIRGSRLNKFGGYQPSQDDQMFRLLLEYLCKINPSLSVPDIESMGTAEKLAWQYIAFAEKAVLDIRNKEDCMIVIYEELCEKPVCVMRKILDFCRLGLVQQTDGFLVESTSRRSKRYYSVFKNPLESAYKWKNDMSVSEQKSVHKQLERSFLACFWSASR